MKRVGPQRHRKKRFSCYRPGVAQRVSSTPRPHFTPGKDPVPILQEAGWDPGPVWTGGNSRPQRDSIPDRPARSQSLYLAKIFTVDVNNENPSSET